MCKDFPSINLEIVKLKFSAIGFSNISLSTAYIFFRPLDFLRLFKVSKSFPRIIASTFESISFAVIVEKLDCFMFLLSCQIQLVNFHNTLPHF